MSRRTTRSMLVAAALLGGAAASAQVQRPSPPQPRPVPARPEAQPPAAAPAAPAAQLTEDARRSLARIHLRKAFEVEVGQLAQQRGQAAEVKELGRRLEQEARRVDVELAGLVRERGVEVQTLALPEEERAPQAQMMARLQELQGEQLDRELVRSAIEMEQRLVQDLKDMRDRTPGEDARLKKWLDDAENVAEAQLAAARDTKRSLDGQRAARRPAGQ